ncbi:MAG: hypothetical protein QOK02_3402 [Mycobacterium sp.]|nr:hypothetical protein [Mycobacterium sp.]
MGDDWRPPTYYHESGHVIAALKRGGYVVSIDLNEVEPETDVPVEPPGRAFKIWAGPWAQAYFEDAENCTEVRVAALFQGQSFFDWPLYEEALDPQRAKEIKVREAAAAAEMADLMPDRPKPDNLPPVTPPDPGWHDELVAAWPEIQQLAISLLRGESPIELRNGQRLVLDEDRADYWSPED